MKKRKLSNTRYNDAYKDRDKGGSSRQGALDWSVFGKEKSPKFFTPREGVNKVNIVPFEVHGKKHPLVKSNKMEIGDLDFMLDIWVHRFIGPDKADLICPKKNYSKHCPICDEVSKLYDDGKKEDAKSLQASRRVYLNIQPIFQGEAQELQIWEVSHYLFMKELMEYAHECKDGADIVAFSDIEAGKVVKFRMTYEQLGKNKVPKFKFFEFLDREEEMDDKLVDEAVAFDQAIILTPAEKIEDVMYGRETAKEEPEKAPAPEKKDKPEPEEEKTPEPEKEEPAKEETKGKCPAGHKWGEADKHPKDCKGCKQWEACLDHEG